MTSEPPHAGAAQRLALSRGTLLRLLGRFEEPASGLTWYLPPSTAPAGLPDDAAQLRTFVEESLTGGVIFWSEHSRVAISPPFPVEQPFTAARLDTRALRELLNRPRTLGVILVRLGGYSVGVYRDGRFTGTKTGGRFVKNRHRKGGQSQRRFERIREGQIREHFDDVAEVVQTRLLPLAAEIDAVVLGGDRHTVQALLKRAPLPPVLAAKLMPRVLDVPEPRREVLERSPTAIWTSRVLVLREPGTDGARG